MLMGEKISEKSLGGMMPIEIVDAFYRQLERFGDSIKKKRALAAAVKLWTELPTEVQLRLLDQSLDTSAFLDLVNSIIDKRLSKKKSSKGD